VKAVGAIERNTPACLPACLPGIFLAAWASVLTCLLVPTRSVFNNTRRTGGRDGNRSAGAAALRLVRRAIVTDAPAPQDCIHLGVVHGTAVRRVSGLRPPK